MGGGEVKYFKFQKCMCMWCSKWKLEWSLWNLHCLSYSFLQIWSRCSSLVLFYNSTITIITYNILYSISLFTNIPPTLKWEILKGKDNSFVTHVTQCLAYYLAHIRHSIHICWVSLYLFTLVIFPSKQTPWTVVFSYCMLHILYPQIHYNSALHVCGSENPQGPWIYAQNSGYI